MLKPALSRGEMQCIGATTLDEYRKYIEKDSALERRFQPIFLEEPTVEETVKILEALRPRYEAHHKVDISDAALGPLPASAIDTSPDGNSLTRPWTPSARLPASCASTSRYSLLISRNGTSAFAISTTRRRRRQNAPTMTRGGTSH